MHIDRKPPLNHHFIQDFLNGKMYNIVQTAAPTIAQPFNGRYYTMYNGHFMQCKHSKIALIHSKLLNEKYSRFMISFL